MPMLDDPAVSRGLDGQMLYRAPFHDGMSSHDAGGNQLSNDAPSHGIVSSHDAVGSQMVEDASFHGIVCARDAGSCQMIDDPCRRGGGVSQCHWPQLPGGL